jgi:hypothetical protein
MPKQYTLMLLILTWTSLATSVGKSPTIRHTQSHSVGSSHDLTSAASETSGERHFGTPLRHVVAVYQLDDGRPSFALEIALLDDDLEQNHPSIMTLEFRDKWEMMDWLKELRNASQNIRKNEPKPTSKANSVFVARVVERERDYEPPNFTIYKFVQRPTSKANSRASTDDLSRIAATICFVAVGVHKIHVIPLSKSTQRSSTTVASSYNEHSSYGILNLVELRLSEHDDSLELKFRYVKLLQLDKTCTQRSRTPLKPAKVLSFAGLASREIAVRLRSIEKRLRPEWESRPYQYHVPRDVSEQISRDPSPYTANTDSLVDTLTAYCVAYNVQPANIRYVAIYRKLQR